MTLRIDQVDWSSTNDQQDVAQMMGVYHADTFGAGAPMNPTTAIKAVADLSQTPHAICFLARKNNQAAGYALCFFGYSSFKAAKLLNIHDLAVHPEHRGQGIGKAMIQTAAQVAKAAGACKLTLEVLENNHVAQKLYQSEGFSASDPATWFWTKPL